MTRGGATYYYHLNARGDVVAMSDGTGAVVNTYAYDPWGQLLSENETVPNPYRYASYRYDSATGLSYCWNRYYAPELARFLTRDIYPGELSDPVTMNPYLYCGGDPVNAVDPTGLIAPALIGGAIVLLALACVITPLLYYKDQKAVDWGDADAVQTEEDVIASCQESHEALAAAQPWAAAGVQVMDVAMMAGDAGPQHVPAPALAGSVIGESATLTVRTGGQAPLEAVGTAILDAWEWLVGAIQ
jgi:RHS repeat-associated protein